MSNSDNTKLVYTPHVPGVIELSEGNPVYIVCKNDVCIADIPTSLVPQALSKVAGCCGSEYRAFRIASPEEIDLFNKVN